MVSTSFIKFALKIGYFRLQYASFSPGGNVTFYELIGYKLTFCKVCVLTKYFYVL